MQLQDCVVFGTVSPRAACLNIGFDSEARTGLDPGKLGVLNSIHVRRLELLQEFTGGEILIIVGQKR